MFTYHKCVCVYVCVCVCVCVCARELVYSPIISVCEREREHVCINESHASAWSKANHGCSMYAAETTCLIEFLLIHNSSCMILYTKY